MRSLFRNVSVLQHDDSVRHAHGGKSVRDQQRHFAFGEFGEALEDFVFGAGVERGRRLIQDEQSARPAGRRGRARSSATRRRKDRVRLRSGGRAIDRNRAEGGVSLRPPGSSERRAECRVCDWLSMRPTAMLLRARHLVAHEVLEDDADFPVQIFDAVIAQIDAVEENAARRRIVEARDELDDRRLALAVLADQRDALARLDPQIEIVEYAARAARIGK